MNGLQNVIPIMYSNGVSNEWSGSSHYEYQIVQSPNPVYSPQNEGNRKIEPSRPLLLSDNNMKELKSIYNIISLQNIPSLPVAFN